MNFFRLIVRRVALGHRASQELYIKYLKKIGVRIGNHIEIFTPASTFIDNTNPHLLQIGSYVSMTGPVTILTHDYSVSVTKKWTHGEILGCQKKTIIGNNVFIGWGACILPGTVIGDNTIIGAHAVVSGELESNAVYGGNPAKKICSINEYYKKRKSNQLIEAVQVYKNYVEVFHKEPSEEIFHEYFYLFAGNNTELDSLPREIVNKFYDHGNYEESLDYFKSHSPKFSSFNEFIDYIKKEAERK